MTKRTRPIHGFTLLELLISIGVIALLIGIIVVSMQGVRAGAVKASSLNSLRNMMRGYIGYSTDNNQRLLPGYLDQTRLDDLNIDVRLANNTLLDQCDGSGNCDASGYVWRLAPYLDDSWKSVFTDYRSQPLESQLTIDFADGAGGAVFGMGSDDVAGGRPGIGRIPSFGLNSIFVGGDTTHGPTNVRDRNPFEDPVDPIAATQTSQVRNPARLIVFGSTRFWDQGTFSNARIRDLEYGYVELRPPFLDWTLSSGAPPMLIDEQWRVDATTRQIEIVDPGSFGDGGGVPIGRWGDDDIPVGHLDGSSETLDRFQISTDLSYWSPFVTGARSQ